MARNAREKVGKKKSYQVENSRAALSLEVGGLTVLT